MHYLKGGQNYDHKLKTLAVASVNSNNAPNTLIRNLIRVFYQFKPSATVFRCQIKLYYITW